MKRIESIQNEQIKSYAKLLHKKYRDEEMLFIVEGKKNIYDSLQNLHSHEVEAILMCDDMLDVFLADFPHLEANIIVTTKKILKKLSDYTSISEIILVAKQRKYTNNIDNYLCLYLDRIRDPGNLGTIIRTAAAAGFGIILDNCCDLFNPKVIRGSMSAMSSVNILQANSDTIDEFKKQGYLVVGADAAGKSIFSFAAGSLKSRLIIVIGNEAEGLSSDILSACDDLVSVPIQNIESLNAALAAGILMFEYRYRVADATNL